MAAVRIKKKGGQPVHRTSHRSAVADWLEAFILYHTEIILDVKQ